MLGETLLKVVDLYRADQSHCRSACSSAPHFSFFRPHRLASNASPSLNRIASLVVALCGALVGVPGVVLVLVGCRG